jgi:hypothetical protein
MIQNTLVVGFGQIGHAIAKIDKDHGIHVEIVDPILNLDADDRIEYDIVHICFPFKDVSQFVQWIAIIEKQFHFKDLIIASTIPPFILSSIRFNYDRHCYMHAPVRGTHPEIEAGLYKYPRMVAPIIPDQIDQANTLAKSYFNQIGMLYILMHCADETSLGKIMSTTWYAMLIAFVNQFQQICDWYHVDFAQSYDEWNLTDDIGRVYFKTDLNDNEGARKMSPDRIFRPTMKPGAIGGHCLMPNLALLKEYAGMVPGLMDFIQWIEHTNRYMQNREEKKHD